MHYNKSVVFIVIILIETINATNKCSWFKNVKVTVHQLDGDPFATTINGCIERIAFNDKTITEAYIQDEKIPTLGPDSVRNMVRLAVVSFYKCEIDTLEPGAFRNVPRLGTVKIARTNLQEIPRDVFDAIPQLELLRLHDNKIRTIQEQAFSNLPKLRRVLLDHNLLDYWNRNWFTNSSNLQILSLQFNQIRTLPRQGFKGLKKLKEISLDFNEIDSLEPRTFEGLKHLSYLGLKNNRLTTVDYAVFNDLVIKKLAVDANYLNYLPNEMLKRLSVKELSLSGNPWKCPCLDNINYWLNVINATIVSDKSCTRNSVPVCAYPTSFSRTCIENVDEELTRNFLNSLKSLKPPLERYCAKLD